MQEILKLLVRNSGGLLFAFALLSACSVAYSTLEKHTHTASDTISTWPTITAGGTHKLHVQAPATGGLLQAVVYQGTTPIIEVHDVAFGECKKASGVLSTNANPPYRFWSQMIDYRGVAGVACLFGGNVAGCVCGEIQPNGPDGE